MPTSSSALGRSLGTALGLALFLAGCSRPRVVTLPQDQDFVFPRPAAGELAPREARALEQAWQQILAGDSRGADARLRGLLAKRPGALSAETALAYSRMRAGQHQAARDGFEKVLTRRADDVAALIGAGSAALALGAPERALERYLRALELDPQSAAARRRVPQLKLQATERLVGAARAAVAAGDRAGAIAPLRQALDIAPELYDLRLELCSLLVDGGQREAAIAVLEADPSGDPQVAARLSGLLVAQGQPARAVSALQRLLTLRPGSAELRRLLGEAQRASELSQMPEEYRRIAGAARVTRADLAALLSVKVTALGRLTPGPARVATDVSGSWARLHILRVLSLDVMDVFSNHTFQPGGLVRRGDLATAVARAVDLLGVPRRPAPVLRDVAGVNLFYEAAARVVSLGLMDVSAEGAFDPWRLVSGRDAVAVIEALARLAGT